jgi:hypothetical protein
LCIPATVRRAVAPRLVRSAPKAVKKSKRPRKEDLRWETLRMVSKLKDKERKEAVHGLMPRAAMMFHKGTI